MMNESACSSSEESEYLAEETERFTLKPPPANLQRALLPSRSKHEYTVVFDLDETLVWHPSPRVVYKRPFLGQLLEALHGKCEMVLWSASTASMGELALNVIDPTGKYFDHVIFRDCSWFKDTPKVKYCKYLSQLNRPASKTLIVENSPNSVRFNKDNGIIVPDFATHTVTYDPTLQLLAQVLSTLISSHIPVPSMLASHPLIERVGLVRRNAYGTPLRCKAPGVFHYLKLRQ